MILQYSFRRYFWMTEVEFFAVYFVVCLPFYFMIVAIFMYMAFVNCYYYLFFRTKNNT